MKSYHNLMSLIKRIAINIVSIFLITLGLFLFLCFIVIISQDLITGIVFLVIALLLILTGIHLLRKSSKNEITVIVESHDEQPYSQEYANEIYFDYPESEPDDLSYDSDYSEDILYGRNLATFSDYRKTIFLHLFEKHPYKETDSFPGYFQYECNIINMPLYFREVQSEGLLCESDPKDILEMLKVPELKSILENHGLKKSGNKPDLIDRILSEIDNTELPSLNHGYYSLSDKGKLFLKTHSDYIELRRHTEWRISFAEYQDAKESAGENTNFNDIVLSLLDKKIDKIRKGKNNENSQYEYSLLSELYISEYHILEAKGWYRDSLKSLLNYLLITVSGYQNYWILHNKKYLNLTKQQAMDRYTPIRVSATLASEINNLHSYYDNKLAEDVYHNFVGPYNLCSFDMFLVIINEIFSSSTLDIAKYNAAIKENFSKKF